VTLSSATRSTPANRLGAPLNNEDLTIFRVTSVDTGDTFTPFGGTLAGTGGVHKSIYKHAVSSIAGGGEEVGYSFVQATPTAAAYFVFICTGTFGSADVYVWAK